MGRAVGANDAGPIQHKGDRQVLDADVVNQLVVGTLQEGAVNSHDGLEPFAGHASRHGDGVLLGDAHIKILIGKSLLQQIKSGAGGHGSGDAHHGGVLFT